MIRVIFFGTEKFARTILKALIDYPQFEVIAVVTQPPRPVGRKQILEKSPVQIMSEQSGIAVFTPTTLKNSTVEDDLSALKPELFIVAQYGLIIPRAILDVPVHGAINVHGSLLPQYRGASPVQTALLNGDKTTGVTFILMDSKMDHGPILGMYALSILETDTTETLLARLATIGALHIGKISTDWISKKIEPKLQDESAVTLTKLFSRTDANIDWKTQSAVSIERMLRAFTPWPGVSTMLNGIIFKLIKIHVEISEVDALKKFEPGTIHFQNKKILIGTTDGVLCIDEIQPAGKNILDAASFFNGYHSLDGLQCANILDAVVI